MFQTKLKSERTTSCSNKKSSKKSFKSISMHQGHLQNTLIKMNNHSFVNVNNSILTQRNNENPKNKGISSAIENETTTRIKSSSKKAPKAIGNLKTDRKAQYAKLKAKQIEGKIERKSSKSKKGTKKAIINEFKVPLNENKLNVVDSNHIAINEKISKLGSFLSDGTHHQSQINKNSDSLVLSEIQKNQRDLLQKIGLLQKENLTLSKKQEEKFNQIKYNHNSQLNFLKEQMKLLHLKLSHQGDNNAALQKKVQSNESQFRMLRQRLQQKQINISTLEMQKKKLSDQLYSNLHVISGCEKKIFNLEKHISELEMENKHLSEQLAKHQQQKSHIRQNCVQVLQLLRQEFGQQFKLLPN